MRGEARGGEASRLPPLASRLPSFTVRSCHSLLLGPSRPEALAARAAELGLRGLVLADEESLAGAVPFWKACRAAGIRPVLGVRLAGRVWIARNRAGYAKLCRLITARKLGRALPEDVDGLWIAPEAQVHDVVFATAREWRIHRLLSAIRRNTLVAHVDGLADPGAFLHAGLVLDEAFLESCTEDFLPAPKIFPREPGELERLKALCEKGLVWRYPDRPPRERLARELGVITKLGYAGYFLVVHDIVAYSRQRGLPVAGRGSGASSVVAYVLGITNVCPVDFGLPFERFLHEGRVDFPDIDVDFSWRVRDEVIRHVFDTWGDVAMVSSHITFQERSAFREAARAYGYSDAQVSALQRGRAEVPDAARLNAAAAALLGLPRHLSVHPGGIVLGPDGVAPLQRAEKGVVVTQYDKDDVEEAGLVKIDLLGNRALSTIRETLEIVERTEGLRIDVERLPARDAAAEALLAEARTLGCNQLESPAMRSLIQMMRPRDAKGLMQALALIRPGAAGQGMKESFVRRVRGLESAPPQARALLPDTHGILLYEDDAMLVVSALAGLPLADGDRFRRRVQKLRTDAEREALSAEFLALAARAGTESAVARDLWTQMAKFSNFSFCRAHAASYGVLAWASAWLAAHHPAAHWVAALNNNQGLYDARVYLEQAKREGIAVRLPCVQRSADEFTLDDRAIRIGLNRIPELMDRERAELLEARPFASLEDVLLRTRLSKPSLRNLVLCGAFDWTGWTRPRILMYLRTGGRDVAGLPELSEAGQAGHELQILGLSARRHLLSYLAPGPRPFDSRGLRGSGGRRVQIVGIMATLRLALTAREEPMEFLTMEDEHGLFEVVLFPQVYRRYRRLLGTIGPYEVTGKVELRHDVLALTAERITGLKPLYEALALR